MTALATDFDPKYSRGDFVAAKAKASTVIYAGSLVMRATGTGYCEPGADTASMVFAGVADDHVASAAGNTQFTLRRTGVYQFGFSGTASEASCGLAVYLVDDQTVALAATTSNDVACGRIVEFIDASTVRIAIDGYC